VDLSQVSFISSKLAAERSDFRLNVGDILVGLTGYVGETGRIPPTETPPMLNQRVGRFKPKQGYGPLVYACVRDSQFNEHAKGKAHGSAQPNVSTHDLLTFAVTIPPENFALAYGIVAEPLLNKCMLNMGEIAALERTRDLLLPKLMSGEILMHDAEKITEAVL
jgi:type I restriction enzyme S subunit